MLYVNKFWTGAYFLVLCFVQDFLAKKKEWLEKTKDFNPSSRRQSTMMLHSVHALWPFTFLTATAVMWLTLGPPTNIMSTSPPHYFCRDFSSFIRCVRSVKLGEGEMPVLVDIETDKLYIMLVSIHFCPVLPIWVSCLHSKESLVLMCYMQARYNRWNVTFAVICIIGFHKLW